MAVDADDFLDLVYDAAADADLWPALVERFARMIGGSSAAFRSYDMLTEIGTVVAFGQDPVLLDRGFRAFTERNPIKSSPEKVRREAHLRESGLLTYKPGLTPNSEWLPQADFVRTEYYNELYKKLDIHSDVSVGLAMNGTEWTGIDVYRSESQGLFTANELAIGAQAVPHLARALKLGRKLTERRGAGDGFAEIFDKSCYGLFLLTRTGHVRNVNLAGRHMMAYGGGVRMVGGRLASPDQSGTQRLQALIERAAANDSEQRSGGSMALPRPGLVRPLSVIVSPLSAEHASFVLEGPAVMVCITDTDAGVTLPEHHLRELFELTASESRVAIALFEGLEPKGIAEKLGVSIATVRTHLSRVFDKTRTSGQIEFTRLITRTLGAGFL